MFYVLEYSVMHMVSFKYPMIAKPSWHILLFLALFHTLVLYHIIMDPHPCATILLYDRGLCDPLTLLITCPRCNMVVVTVYLKIASELSQSWLLGHQ